MAEAPWWRDAVVYQIYPRSFADSNGDGIGDLPGITGRLDYLADLGVDAVWLSPIFVSPMRDFGYDVADYCAIDPVFGTDADLDELVAGLHDRGMRLLLDWVPWYEWSPYNEQLGYLLRNFVMFITRLPEYNAKVRSVYDANSKSA